MQMRALWSSKVCVRECTCVCFGWGGGEGTTVETKSGWQRDVHVQCFTRCRRGAEECAEDVPRLLNSSVRPAHSQRMRVLIHSRVRPMCTCGLHHRPRLQEEGGRGVGEGEGEHRTRAEHDCFHMSAAALRCGHGKGEEG